MQKYKTILKRISLPASWLSLSLLYFVFNKECFACQPPPLATTKYVKISGIYFVVFELRRISSCTLLTCELTSFIIVLILVHFVFSK